MILSKFFENVLQSFVFFVFFFFIKKPKKPKTAPKKPNRTNRGFMIKHEKTEPKLLVWFYIWFWVKTEPQKLNPPLNTRGRHFA